MDEYSAFDQKNDWLKNKMSHFWKKMGKKCKKNGKKMAEKWEKNGVKMKKNGEKLDWS